MFVAGIGIGPTFAVFTFVVQNSVPIARLGTATSNLTLFQQVGGTVGLAVTGTIFASVLRDQVPRRCAAKGAAEPLGSRCRVAGRLGGTSSPPWVTWARTSWRRPRAGPSAGRALHRGDRRRHLRGLLARDGQHLPGRHRGRRHRAAVVLLMQEAPREVTETTPAGPLYTEHVGERPES